MTDVPPTRSGLLELQEKRELAEKGHGLLEKKRDALIHKFFELIDEYKEKKQSTYHDLKKAYGTLHKAQAVNGVDRVRSVGFSQEDALQIALGTENLMGVTVPDYTVRIQSDDRNVSPMEPDQSLTKAAEQFRIIAKQLVQLSELENTIHKLSEAIQKTKRRVNSLEHVKIPEMEAVEKQIDQKLMEKERQRFASLKQMKK